LKKQSQQLAKKLQRKDKGKISEKENSKLKLSNDQVITIYYPKNHCDFLSKKKIIYNHCVEIKMKKLDKALSFFLFLQTLHEQRTC